MNPQVKKVSRKKFVWWGIAISSILAIPAFLQRNKKRTVKMLSKDGLLVEVDASMIPTKKKKISDDAIHEWLKNK